MNFLLSILFLNFHLGSAKEGAQHGDQSTTTEDAAPGSRSHGGETGGGDQPEKEAVLLKRSSKQGFQDKAGTPVCPQTDGCVLGTE